MRASHSCAVLLTAHPWGSITSLRWSIGLRSGHCKSHFSTVNSLSRSRNQYEITWGLWHDVLSCWKQTSEDAALLQRDGHGQQQQSAFKWCSVGTKGPKVYKENIPYNITPPPAAQTVDTGHDASMLSCVWTHILFLLSELHCPNLNLNPLLSNFSESVWIVTTVSCSYKNDMHHGLLQVSTCCVQRCSEMWLTDWILTLKGRCTYGVASESIFYIYHDNDQNWCWVRT